MSESKRLSTLARSCCTQLVCAAQHNAVLGCRLVVVLERRTLVHDLKTLELLRTLETPPNPKVLLDQKAALSFYPCVWKYIHCLQALPWTVMSNVLI